MSENKYTAADFANVEFATKNGLFAACRSRSGFWRTESGVALVDRDMAAGGWVPVPSSPTRSRRTHSGFGSCLTRSRWTNSDSTTSLTTSVHSA